MNDIKDKSWLLVCGIVLAITLAFAWNAQADSNAPPEEPIPPTPPLMLKITSFQPIGDIRAVNAAEVCGRVIGNDNKITALQVIADYRTNNPGHYLAQTLPNGRFCHVIMTYRGQVEVRILNADSSQTPAPPADEIKEGDLTLDRLEQYRDRL